MAAYSFTGPAITKALASGSTNDVVTFNISPPHGVNIRNNSASGKLLRAKLGRNAVAPASSSAGGIPVDGGVTLRIPCRGTSSEARMKLIVKGSTTNNYTVWVD